jgi:hypothetical protein
MNRRFQQGVVSGGQFVLSNLEHTARHLHITVEC